MSGGTPLPQKKSARRPALGHRARPPTLGSATGYGLLRRGILGTLLDAMRIAPYGEGAGDDSRRKRDHQPLVYAVCCGRASGRCLAGPPAQKKRSPTTPTGPGVMADYAYRSERYRGCIRLSVRASSTASVRLSRTGPFLGYPTACRPPLSSRCVGSAGPRGSAGHTAAGAS